MPSLETKLINVRFALSLATGALRYSYVMQRRLHSTRLKKRLHSTRQALRIPNEQDMRDSWVRSRYRCRLRTPLVAGRLCSGAGCAHRRKSLGSSQGPAQIQGLRLRCHVLVLHVSTYVAAAGKSITIRTYSSPAPATQGRKQAHCNTRGDCCRLGSDRHAHLQCRGRHVETV